MMKDVLSMTDDIPRLKYCQLLTNSRSPLNVTLASLIR